MIYLGREWMVPRDHDHLYSSCAKCSHGFPNTLFRRIHETDQPDKCKARLDRKVGRVRVFFKLVAFWILRRGQQDLSESKHALTLTCKRLVGMIEGCCGALGPRKNGLVVEDEIAFFDNALRGPFQIHHIVTVLVFHFVDCQMPFCVGAERDLAYFFVPL